MWNTSTLTFYWEGGRDLLRCALFKKRKTICWWLESDDWKMSFSTLSHQESIHRDWYPTTGAQSSLEEEFPGAPWSVLVHLPWASLMEELGLQPGSDGSWADLFRAGTTQAAPPGSPVGPCSSIYQLSRGLGQLCWKRAKQTGSPVFCGLKHSHYAVSLLFFLWGPRTCFFFFLKYT